MMTIIKIWLRGGAFCVEDQNTNEAIVVHDGESFLFNHMIDLPPAPFNTNWTSMDDGSGWIVQGQEADDLLFLADDVAGREAMGQGTY